MGCLLKVVHLFDNRKQRNYVSDAGKMLSEFDRDHPIRSDSQRHEIRKHRDIFQRKSSHGFDQLL